MNHRVVITGLGVVTPIGIGADVFWENVLQGKSGITKVQKFDTREYQSDFAGCVLDFLPEKYVKNIPIQSLGRVSQFSVAAARMAIEDADISLTDDLFENTAVIMGATLGEEYELDRVVENQLNKGEFESYKDNYIKFPVHNMSNSISLEFGFKGDSIVIPNACAAGNFAISYAYNLIKKGRRTYAVAGGADPLSEQAFRGFSRLRSLSNDVCRPFDKNRKGLVIGEGAGVLFLETLDSAKKRGAKIYAEIIGCGSSCDAYHMVMPDPSAAGIQSAMNKAIQSAGIHSSEIDYVCAHGTGTAANDKAESLALKLVFGENHSVPISSIKSMIGHTMGAASAIESAACCLALRDGIMPPTINFQEPDPECNVDCVPNVPVKKDLNIIANNAYAFGGNNSCILFKKMN